MMAAKASGSRSPSKSRSASPAPRRPSKRHRSARSQILTAKRDSAPPRARKHPPQASHRPTGRHYRITPGRTAIGVGLTAVIVTGILLASGVIGPLSAQSAVSPPAMAQVVRHGEVSSLQVEKGGAWLTNDLTATAQQFNPHDGQLMGRAVKVPRVPIDSVFGYGKLWVASVATSTVTPVNPRAEKAGEPIAVGSDPVGLAAGYGAIWVASLVAGTVSRIDPYTAKVVATVSLPNAPVRITTGAGSVWATGQGGVLIRIDPVPQRGSLRYSTLKVGKGPIGIAIGHGAVWVADTAGNTVTRIDLSNLKDATSFKAGYDPEEVAVWHNLLWVASGTGDTLRAFYPATGRPDGPALKLPGSPRELTLGKGALWVATAHRSCVVEILPR